MQTDLYYIQVHSHISSYWYYFDDNNEAPNWAAAEDCFDKVIPTKVGLFEAKQIINKDKKEEIDLIYFLIPAIDEIKIIT